MGIWKRVNRKLLPMKLVMFGWFGASACALPFFTVHMQELGLSVEQTAIIYTFLPITQFLSSPIAGFIADRLGKYRNVLLFSILMTVVFCTAVMYVPRIQSPVSILSCHEDRIAAMPCIDINTNNSHPKPLHLRTCTVDCHDHDTWDMDVLLQERINSSSCEYKILNITLHDRNSSSMCGSFMGLNCNVKCDLLTENLSSSELLSLHESGYERYWTFALYAVLRIVYNIFSAIGFTLVNSSAIALTETNTQLGEYGRQRFWAMVAMAIFSPVAGLLVDVLSVSTNHINYAPAFHTHNILSVFTAVAVWYLDFEMEEAPTSYKETFKNFWFVIKSPSIAFLLIVVFWLGTMWGFLESFLFLFMKELSSPTYMMGLTVAVGSIVGLPFLYYSRWIVSKVGHAPLLSVALLMYMIRGIGCSFLLDPWWIMPFETLEIFTFHLMWVSAATYAAHLSPAGLLATIQGFIEGVHYGVGQGSGSLIGGSLISTLGGLRPAFRVMGAISGCLSLLYGILHLIWLRNKDVQPRSRRASVKSSHSQRPGRKTSTVSTVEPNGVSLASLSQSLNPESGGDFITIPLN